MAGTTGDRLRAEIAANSRWAAVTDRTKETSPAREGFHAKLRTQARELLGPDATDEDVERSYQNLLSAHYARMRRNSLKTRQARAAARVPA